MGAPWLARSPPGHSPCIPLATADPNALSVSWYIQTAEQMESDCRFDAVMPLLKQALEHYPKCVITMQCLLLWSLGLFPVHCLSLRERIDGGLFEIRGGGESKT